MAYQMINLHKTSGNNAVALICCISDYFTGYNAEVILQTYKLTFTDHLHSDAQF